MSHFIDRRNNSPHKGAVNRRRFIQRFKKYIHQTVNQAIAGRKITEIESSEQVSIPAQDLNEPIFQKDRNGLREIVLPGNQDFLPHDRIPRPLQSGQSKSGQRPGATPDPSSPDISEDDFIFTLSKDEFLEFFFEDLELPDLIKTQIRKIPQSDFVRAGTTTMGVPKNLNLPKTLKNAISRKLIVRRHLLQKISEIESQFKSSPAPSATKIKILNEQLQVLNTRLKNIPFVDPNDARYTHREQQPKPTTQAVMFCILDVSGSMDEAKKDLAKRFFILLYLFLVRQYKTIELVFIRHHTSAREVNEQDFFYSRETGGTVVSSALELLLEIMQSRYPNPTWNRYVAQASDGDNWNNDSPKCATLLATQILPVIQYYAYLEIMPRQPQSLWQAYETLLLPFKNFAMQAIQNQTEIFPVLHRLFKKHA